METDVAKPKLRLQLIAMAREDQDMRNRAMLDRTLWDSELDKKHTEKLKRIIAQHGWPTISMVGAEASNDAWLIAQHSDHDLDFQKECLRLLKLVPSGEITLNNIAYLEDRLLVAEHKPQLYGTQFQGTGADLRPQPIGDESHVNQRRKKMGLGTLEEYTNLMQEIYGKSS